MRKEKEEKLLRKVRKMRKKKKEMKEVEGEVVFEGKEKNMTARLFKSK